MNGIVKRRKTSSYTQIHNTPLQTLDDIRSIGLMAHLMSLPDDWEIKKMQLYSKFGRAAITHAIKELESKKYWLDIKYRIGKLNEHIYYISDVPFTDGEVTEIIEEIGINYKIMEISKPFQHLLSIVGNKQLKNDSSIDDFQQLNINNCSSTIENRQQQNKYIQKKYKQINNNKINNIVNLQEQINNEEINNEDVNNVDNVDNIKNEMLHIANEFYNEFAPGRWTKDQWYSLITRFIDETIESGRYKNIEADKIRGYVYKSIENIAYHYDFKYKKVNTTKEEINGIPVLDWVFGGSED
jgi:hypothetical protein